MLRTVRPTSLALSAAIALFALLALSPLSCTTKEPSPQTYFDQTIAPILTASCVRANTGVGCHQADARGNSLGNLDLSIYDNVYRRRDLLLNHGPYGQASLLLKNIEPFDLNILSYDGTQEPAITTDIIHSGGPLLSTTADAYTTLRRWIQNGATDNNTGQAPASIPRDACVSGSPPTSLEGFPTSVLGFDPAHDPSKLPDPGFSVFQSQVQPFLRTTCAAGNCHGTATNVLYLLCGDTAQQVAWNYWVLSQYVTGLPGCSAATPSNQCGGQFLNRPLANGTFHEGGIIFQGISDPNYQLLLAFANARGPAKFSALTDPSLSLVPFFAHRIQPVLARKGCMMVQCHSPAMFHDYRLRGGTGGSFSFFATLRNYTSSLLQLSIESPDVRASRIVRKNLLTPAKAVLPPPTPLGTSDAGAVSDAGAGPPGGTPSSAATAFGIDHRGGPLFEDFGNDEPSDAACMAGNYNYDKCVNATCPAGDLGSLDTVPAFCMISEWHRRELAARQTGPNALAPLSAIVYVQRTPAPAAPDRAQDYDVFAGGAELHIAAATLTATSDIQLGGSDVPFPLGSCGLTGSADIRRPAVSWDGSKVAFAARTDASQPLQIYEITIATMTCTKHALNSIKDPTCAPQQGLVHNFDPAYAPDGQSLVFASTRGNLDLAQANFDYCGPQRTPADPTKLNSNLYVYEPDPAKAGQFHLRQLTYVLDMERYPSFMSDGRLIFTSEKREPGFYELALRRINLDGGDYHPLYSQRGTIGAYQATYPIELADKNFAAIFSAPNALHGAGALVRFNRSIGLDLHSNAPTDYVVDPTVLNPASLSHVEDGTEAPTPNGATPVFFLHSLDQAIAQPTTVYTSPAPLPGGKVLVSVAQGDPTSFTGTYNVVVLDPEHPGGAPAQLFANGVDAVAVYARANKGTFPSSPDEPNGHTHIVQNTLDADITVLDMPVLSSLLFQNTPTGRLVENLTGFDVYEELPADATPSSMFVATDNLGPIQPMSNASWTGKVSVKRRLLGTVNLASDGSAHFEIPGGVPIVLHLHDTPQSTSLNLPRYQREEMEFAPGEVVNQSFIGSTAAAQNDNFFNGLCGNCHGAISGRQIDVGVKPDILTQASMVAARGGLATNLDLSPSMRPAPVGPPSTP